MLKIYRAPTSELRMSQEIRLELTVSKAELDAMTRADVEALFAAVEDLRKVYTAAAQPQKVG